MNSKMEQKPKELVQGKESAKVDWTIVGPKNGMIRFETGYLLTGVDTEKSIRAPKPKAAPEK